MERPRPSFYLRAESASGHAETSYTRPERGWGSPKRVAKSSSKVSGVPRRRCIREHDGNIVSAQRKLGLSQERRLSGTALPREQHVEASVDRAHEHVPGRWDHEVPRVRIVVV